MADIRRVKLQELRADRADTEPFSVVVRERGEEATIAVAGEIDLATAPALRGVLFGVIEAGAHATVVLDIADVTFIDSTGLGVVVDAHRRLADEHRRLVVAHPTPGASRVIEVAGLDHLLDIRR